MEISASREAAFPSEAVTFSVPSSAGDDIVWTGGGEPATGDGPTFTTSFARGGEYTVVARRGGTEARFAIVVCPIDVWLIRAREFFGPSIDFDGVRVTTSWAVRGPPGTAWTCNAVIRFKRPKRATDVPVESTLIHELGHVWEHQNGQAQLLSGVVEQVGRLFGRDPYDYGGPDGLRHATALTRFRKESQAQIIAEHWKVLHGYGSDRVGIDLSTAGYAEDLRRLVVGAGIGVSPASRRTVAGTIDTAVAKVVNLALGRPR
jgi:hypothetical protein